MSVEAGDCTFPRIQTKAQNGVIQPILTGNMTFNSEDYFGENFKKNHQVFVIKEVGKISVNFQRNIAECVTFDFHERSIRYPGYWIIVIAR